MSDGDGTHKRKEITVKIFRNGVFHITGVIDDSYDKDAIDRIQAHITAHCPTAILGTGWGVNERRVVLMNYKTKLIADAISRDALYASLRAKGVKVVYEPNVYPAVKIYFPDTKWIAKVFRTGQVILTGMTKKDECALVVSQLTSILAA